MDQKVRLPENNGASKRGPGYFGKIHIGVKFHLTCDDYACIDTSPFTEAVKSVAADLPWDKPEIGHARSPDSVQRPCVYIPVEFSDEELQHRECNSLREYGLMLAQLDTSSYEQKLDEVVKALGKRGLKNTHLIEKVAGVYTSIGHVYL